MNKAFISGRLVRDPELKYTGNNIPVLNFTVAVAKNFGEGVDFVDCVAFRKTAEIVNKYLKKGSLAFFEGEITVNTWEDKEGAMRKNTNVLVNRVEFLPQDKQPNKDEEETEDEYVKDENLVDGYLSDDSNVETDEIVVIETDDDLPF